MIDNLNPTSQFHPYQSFREIPNAEKPQHGLTMARVRGYARSNRGKTLGVIAVLAIGAGLMRKRRRQ